MSARISEILWKAANEHLWDGLAFEPDWPTGGGEMFSCCAASNAETAAGAPYVYGYGAREFLESLMCSAVERNGGFLDSLPQAEQQQVRYAWLMFASMVAAEMEARGEL